jgi:hypothetical protein
MASYDPDRPPRADWLQTDEGERVEIVASYHHRGKIDLPNTQLHAVIHVVVENQLALGDPVVVETLARLQKEGLTRHDALHAIGSVLAPDLFELMQENTETTGETYHRYLDRLQKLTAKAWRAS